MTSGTEIMSHVKTIMDGVWTPLREPYAGVDGECTTYLVLSLALDGVAGGGKSFGWCLVLTMMELVLNNLSGLGEVAIWKWL